MLNGQRSKVLLSIRHCPGESDVPADVKLNFQTQLETAFGDFKVINCEKIKSKDDHILFCEMLIMADKVDKGLCPEFAKIVRVIAEDV